MTIKSIVIALFFSFLSILSYSQNFESEYFQFEDFEFMDEMNHADFNGDGLPDFLIGASNFGKLRVGINTGISSPNFSEITDVRSIQKTIIVDIDSDGDYDVIGLRQFSGVYAFINDGNASFVTNQLDINEYESIAFEDMTGNGEMEMIVSSFDIKIYQIEKSTLEFNEIYSGDFGSGSIGALAIIDHDNDGNQDIIMSTESDGLMLLKQSGQLEFESSMLYADNYDVDDITIVNLTNDGIIDFVLYSNDDKRGKVVVSDFAGQYTEEILNEDDITNSLTLVGDLNADSKEEIITFEYTNFNDPKLSIKEYNSGLENLDVISGHFASSAGGIVDLDNDGDEDFYFFQNDNSQPGLFFYLAGTQVVDLDGDGFDSEVDCDDTDPDVNPEATEIVYNGIDDDCNPLTLDDDLDQDGFDMEVDCNDTDPSINPDAIEIPDNGVDDNCDGISSTYELNEITIKVFPNPTEELIHIQADGELNFIATLYDINGMLLTQGRNSTHIILEHLPDGTYLLEIKDQHTSHSITEMIVKKSE